MQAEHDLYVVDAQGGALSALAAGIGAAMGVRVVAATVANPESVPADVRAALEEIGLTAPDQIVEIAAPAPGARVVFVGTSPPPAFAGVPVWPLALTTVKPAPHPGDGLPADFERMTSIRRARDAIERALAASASAPPGR